MTATLHHRGPDDRGVWVDAAAGIALGHTRLAVVDLSPAGAQPMVSGDGRIVLVFNGEIYNADELRRELTRPGTSFRGHSDTEVLVEALAAWGVERSLRRALGMFAFAAWDRRDRKLVLARDRLGKKPLYWSSAQWPRDLRLGAQGAARRPGPAARDRSRRAGRLSALALRPGPAMHLSRTCASFPPAIGLKLPPCGETRLAAYWSPVQPGLAEPRERSDDEAWTSSTDCCGTRSGDG